MNKLTRKVLVSSVLVQMSLSCSTVDLLGVRRHLFKDLELILKSSAVFGGVHTR